MLSLDDNASMAVMNNVVIKVFKQMFLVPGSFHIDDWDVEFPTLDELTTRSPEIPFFEDKIFMVLKDSDGKKDPGPDEFSVKFPKSFWPIFKEDLISLFQSFHSSVSLIRGLLILSSQ